MFLMPAPAPALDATVTHTATGTIQGTNATVFTFSGLDIYDTKNARKVVVVAGGQGDGVDTVSGLTVDGNACSLAVAATPENETNCEMWYVDLDSATATGDIVVTWTPNKKGNCGVDVFVVEGAASGAPSQTLTSNASPGTNDLDINAGGVGIAGWYVNTGTASARTTSWAGLTEASDQNDTTEQVAMSSASDAFAATQTNLTITATLNGTSTDQAMVMASWDKA